MAFIDNDRSEYFASMLSYSESVAASVEECSSDMMASLMQVRKHSAAIAYEQIGLCKYAIGRPVCEVRDALARSSMAWEEVFRLRPVEFAAPLEGVGARQAVVSCYSKMADVTLTNSRRNLRATCVAWSAGQFDCASRIAGLAWDPMNAPYVSVKSEICRPCDQALAYASKQLVVGDVGGAIAELNRIGPVQSVRAEEMSRMFRAICRRNPEEFCESLGRMLAWYRQCDYIRGDYDIDFRADQAFCIWAIGMCAFALHVNLIRVADLPPGDPLLPRELICIR